MKNVINKANDKMFNLDEIKEFYDQAELTNRLLGHEPGVDSETAEEWAQPIITKDGRKGTAFFIFDKEDYPEDADDMSNAAEFLPWDDTDYIKSVYVE